MVEENEAVISIIGDDSSVGSGSRKLLKASLADGESVVATVPTEVITVAQRMKGQGRESNTIKATTQDVSKTPSPGEKSAATTAAAEAIVIAKGVEGREIELNTPSGETQDAIGPIAMGEDFKSVDSKEEIPTEQEAGVSPKPVTPVMGLRGNTLLQVVR